MSDQETVYIATRGSALALAQSGIVLEQCKTAFPGTRFELKVIKTTGDKLQTINLTNPNQQVTKGLFTKELEEALLNGEADFAVHSLKDLPTELPPGLHLAGVSNREDVRDVLIFHRYPPQATLKDFETGATIASSSTRRQAQVLAQRPDLKTVPIRGNVGTRIRKLWENDQLHGTILAMAGMKRLGFTIDSEGSLKGTDVPEGTCATVLSLDIMLPCVGQAALGFECRIDDSRANQIIAALNSRSTFHCVAAERSFLASMGGGCLSPVAAFAQTVGDNIHLRTLSFQKGRMERAEQTGPAIDAVELGRAAAAALL